LRIIAVCDPANPIEVGYCYTPGDAQCVAVSGNYAYVADSYAGLRVISVSDPAHPVEVGYYNTPGRANGVAVSGDCAYVADGDSGLRVISVADPTHPVEAGYYHTPGPAVGVTARGYYVYVAEGGTGLRIYMFYGVGVEETPSAEVQMTGWAPTIVRGVLLLLPSLPTPDCPLLSVDGRKVAELHAGANDVSHLAPGVYFIRGPKTEDGRPAAAVRKVVLTE
jgi:hypothetical protein